MSSNRSRPRRPIIPKHSFDECYLLLFIFAYLSRLKKKKMKAQYLYPSSPPPLLGIVHLKRHLPFNSNLNRDLALGNTVLASKKYNPTGAEVTIIILCPKHHRHIVSQALTVARPSSFLNTSWIPSGTSITSDSDDASVSGDVIGDS